MKQFISNSKMKTNHERNWKKKKTRGKIRTEQFLLAFKFLFTIKVKWKRSQKKCCGSLRPSSWPTAAIDHNSVRHSNTRCAHSNELTDIQGHEGCSLRSLFRTALNCYDIKHVFAWEKLSRRHVSEEGRT